VKKETGTNRRSCGVRLRKNAWGHLRGVRKRRKSCVGRHSCAKKPKTRSQDREDKNGQKPTRGTSIEAPLRRVPHSKTFSTYLKEKGRVAGRLTKKYEAVETIRPLEHRKTPTALLEKATEERERRRAEIRYHHKKKKKKKEKTSDFTVADMTTSTPYLAQQRKSN